MHSIFLINHLTDDDNMTEDQKQKNSEMHAETNFTKEEVQAEKAFKNKIDRSLLT